MPVVIGGLMLAFLVMLLFGGTEIDRGLLMLFAQLDAPQLKSAALVLGELAMPVPLACAAAAGAAFLAGRRQWRRALVLLGAVLVGMMLLHAVGVWTAPLRPTLNERLFEDQQQLFPNFPAAAGTIAFIALAFSVTRHRPARPIALGLAAFLSLAIGFGQIAVGRGWPSDVIGGWALGLAWTLLLFRLAREDLGEGTVRPLRHSLRKGEGHGEPQDRNRARE